MVYNIDNASLKAARTIENIFWQDHKGGAAQVVSRIQIVVRDAIKEALAENAPV